MKRDRMEEALLGVGSCLYHVLHVFWKIGEQFVSGLSFDLIYGGAKGLPVLSLY